LEHQTKKRQRQKRREFMATSSPSGSSERLQSTEAAPKGENIATIGEYLRAAQVVMDVRPATFSAYSIMLRRIAGDILSKRTARKAKIKAKRATRQAIEESPLTIFTPEAVQSWRLALCGEGRGRWPEGEGGADFFQLHAAAGAKPIRPQGCEVSENPAASRTSAIRRGGVFPRESMRYTSKIDAGIVMRQAREELERRTRTRSLSCFWHSGPDFAGAR